MEQEHPASMTARAVKQALPDRAIVTKDARVMLNTATSMFTLYLSTIAHDISTKNKRSTITLKDVLSALKETDFDHFIEPVEQCLQDTKAADARKRARKEAQKAGGAVEGGVDMEGATEPMGDAAVDGAQEEQEEVPMETDADLEGEQTIDEDEEAEEDEDVNDDAIMDEGAPVDAKRAAVEASAEKEADAASEDAAMEETKSSAE